MRLSASASGQGHGALMLVIGAGFVVLGFGCARGANFLRRMGAEDADSFVCGVFYFLGFALIVLAIIWFFLNRRG